MNIFFKNIEELGKECFHEHPISFKKTTGSSFPFDKNSWVDSVKYFYFHAFMRGRTDSLSERYFKYFLKVIDVEFCNDFSQFRVFINSNSADQIKQLFEIPYLINTKETFLNNKKDINMILSSFEKMNAIEDGNIINFLVKNISNNLEEKYKYLNEISEIGPKISSFLLRNIVLHNKFSIKKNDIKFLLPIDTWIDKICLKREIYQDKMNIDQKRQNIISMCYENNVDPLLFNQGLWYLGSTSLDVSIKILSKYEYNC